MTTATAVQDTLWNLRTWPLEWVEWATNNTHRLDIYFQKDSHSRDRGLLTTPLPNNERNQASCSVIFVLFAPAIVPCADRGLLSAKHADGVAHEHSSDGMVLATRSVRIDWNSLVETVTSTFHDRRPCSFECVCRFKR